MTPPARKVKNDASNPRGTGTSCPAELELEEPVSDIGVAIAEIGEYVTPLRVAATSKTEPPPYS